MTDLEEVRNAWMNRLGSKPMPKDGQFVRWLSLHDREVLCDAIRTVQIRSSRWPKIDARKVLDRCVQECSRICNEQTYRQAA